MNSFGFSKFTKSVFIPQSISENKTLIRIYKQRWLFLLLLPGLLYFIVFKYLPMFGLVIVLKDYYPALGFLGSKWVGAKHFIRFFTEKDFLVLLRNTLLIFAYNLIVFTPIPIILALLLNEIKSIRYKRLIQTVTYLPHFLSWPVIVSITYIFLTTEGGLVNSMMLSMGMEKVNFLMEPSYFRPMIILQHIWKDMGWGTIIYLSAITSIEQEMYEASRIDGANRFQQLIYITLPSIASTIIVLIILRFGHALETGFEQIYLMVSPTTRSVGDVFDTYTYFVGFQGGQFSYASAIGMFKSVVGLTLVLTTNRLSKKFGYEGIY